jgi:RNA polymerase sigma-70 factor, ECF subfamily
MVHTSRDESRYSESEAVKNSPSGPVSPTTRADSQQAAGFSPEQWQALVAQIKAGDEAGMEQLYRIFHRGIRFYLCRQCGPQELDDKVHDTFLIVVNAIRREAIREPERLMGFVRTVVRRQVAAYIGKAVKERNNESEEENWQQTPDTKITPEQHAISAERAALVRKSLAALSSRDREILIRYYLNEEPQEQIRREMSLTETQFRLIKSRAKAKFGEEGRKRLSNGRGLFSVFTRASAAS